MDNDHLWRLVRSVLSSTIPQGGTMAGLADDMSIGHCAVEDDRTALEAFFSTHHGRLLRVCGLVCGDLAPAEDIVQTALERAWRSRDSINDDTRMRPWLDRIVVREAAR